MYRYLTNEAVILINRIVAESSFAFRWFTFVLQFCVSLLFLQLLWDSENDVSTSAVLSVVMPVHLVYDGTMIGAACARDDQDRFIWKFDFQTVFLTFVLSIRRCMIAHVWSYSTPRAVTVPSILEGLSPSDLVLAVHYTRLIVVWLGLSPYGYIASSLTKKINLRKYIWKHWRRPRVSHTNSEKKIII